MKGLGMGVGVGVGMGVGVGVNGGVQQSAPAVTRRVLTRRGANQPGAEALAEANEAAVSGRQFLSSNDEERINRLLLLQESQGWDKPDNYLWDSESRAVMSEEEDGHSTLLKFSEFLEESCKIKPPAFNLLQSTGPLATQRASIIIQLSSFSDRVPPIPPAVAVYGGAIHLRGWAYKPARGRVTMQIYFDAQSIKAAGDRISALTAADWTVPVPVVN
ncbi:hypothetical protein WJX73_004324 [Symbiochloris irregularis]|uniref:Uncharacterized protein n=1 Tax=Symbiochloris irregularis TaxID=706552 RepID=A0AAW1NNT6_9CHLO